MSFSRWKGIIVLSQSKKTFLICFTKTIFVNFVLNIVENFFNSMIFNPLKYINYKKVNIIGYLMISSCINGHITTSTKQIYECIYVMWKILLYIVNYAILIANIIKRSFISHLMFIFFVKKTIVPLNLECCSEFYFYIFYSLFELI